MTEYKEQFDETPDLKVSGKLKSDLEALFKPHQTVPPEIDRAILAKASQKLMRSRTRFYILRWAGPVAAAAAVIIFAVLFMNQGAPADIDRNGRVDILDAFKLAKVIQSENTADKKWDINGDGLVDKGDVETIAYAAVSLDKGV